MRCAGWVAMAMLLLTSCTPGGRGRDVYVPPPPKYPPSYPKPVTMPIDPALRAAAQQELRKALDHQEAFVRVHAIEAMRQVMPEEARKNLLRAMNDPESSVRFAGCMAAGELRAVENADRVKQLASDPDNRVRIAARFALHRFGDYKLSHDFERFALSPNPQDRGTTAMALGLLEEPTAVRVLKSLAKDSKPQVRLQAMEALWRYHDREGLEGLAAAALSRYPDDKMVALLGLAAPRDARVLGHLQSELVAEHVEVQLVAARAVGMVGKDHGYGIALIGMNSPDSRHRLLAALAFGDIGRADAQPYLAKLLQDQTPEVRVAAATGLLLLR